MICRVVAYVVIKMF